MSRLHLFEFFDQTWVPRVLANLGVEYLAFVERLARGPVEALIPPLVKGLEASPHNESAQAVVVDLCSGAAGPWPLFLEKLPNLHLTLSDLQPHLRALRGVTSCRARQGSVPRRTPQTNIGTP